MSDRNRTPTIQSLDRGPAILEAVGSAMRLMSLAELNRGIRIDRSSVFRLAKTLKQRGFLTQLPDTKSYTLGPAIWRLAGQMRQSNSLVQVARQYVALWQPRRGRQRILRFAREIAQCLSSMS